MNTLTIELLYLMFGPNLRYALCYARARIYQNQLSVVVIIDFLVSNFFQVLEARDTLPVNMRNPLLVKIAPDLSEDDKEDIAAVVSRNKVCSLLSLFLKCIAILAYKLCIAQLAMETLFSHWVIYCTKPRQMYLMQSAITQQF